MNPDRFPDTQQGLVTAESELAPFRESRAPDVVVSTDVAPVVRPWRTVPARADGRPTISVSMIVRDEASVLERCLAPIAGIVDEIVIVDTGSADETKTIAAHYTDRIANFTWIDDFAAARQRAFDLATGDWIVWLDADETLVGAERLHELIADLDPEISSVLWQTVMDVDAFGEARLVFWRERLVRNDSRFRWAGRVHEVLVPVAGEPAGQIRTDDVYTLHHHHTNEGSGLSDRNLRILQAELAVSDQQGASPNPRTLYYLAREYADHGDIPQAILALERYVDVATWADEQYLAYIQLGDLHKQRGMYAFALDTFFKAMRIHPRWPIAYFSVASVSYFQHEWDKVIHWVEVGKSLLAPETPLFLAPRALDHDWIIHYTNALWNTGRADEAIWWTQHALGNDPDDQWHRTNLRYFRSQRGFGYRRSLGPPTTGEPT